MKYLRIGALALLITILLVASGPNQAKACSGTSVRALEICFNRCNEAFPGTLNTVERAACFLGCQIGCAIYGTN